MKYRIQNFQFLSLQRITQHMRMILLILILTTITTITFAKCPNHCSFHGECIVSELGRAAVCDCDTGYFGPDCSYRECPYGKAWVDIAVDSDDAHRDARCSNMGRCDFKTGDCVCNDGFTGAACERTTCPYSEVSEHACSSHGVCMSIGRMSSSARFEKTSYNQWDSDRIFGCVCDRGFESQYDCSLGSCPTGDDPMTENQLNEIQYFQCDLNDEEERKSSFYICWRGGCTDSIMWNDSESTIQNKLNSLQAMRDVRYSETDVAIEVTFLESHTGHVCAGMSDDVSPQRVKVEFKRHFGDLEPLEFHFHVSPDGTIPAHPILTHTCKTLTNPFKAQRCAGTTLITSDGLILQPNVGTKEEATCSNRGVCDDTKSCVCDVRFTSSDGEGQSGLRGDCGFKIYELHLKEHADDANIPVQYDCIGEIPCSGHGTCTGAPSYECQCFDDWTAPDCSERSCPKGRTWYGPPGVLEGDSSAHNMLVECSRRGACDRVTGTCTCAPGFTGAACESIACPLGIDNSLPCSGHGRCLSMKDMAMLAGTTYGSEPNDAATWDYNKISGCFCDEGFGGIACEDRLCPSGDNPLTPGSPEIQKITCSSRFVAEDGTSVACFSGPSNDRLILDIKRIRGVVPVRNYYRLGDGACRDESGLEPQSYSQVVSVMDYCAQVCTDLGNDCEGFSFCTGIGYNASLPEPSCKNTCLVYSSSGPQTNTLWQLYEPTMPVGVEAADEIETVSIDEPWWQCYTKNPVDGVSYPEDPDPYTNLNLFENSEDALSHCASSSVCYGVALLYAHEFPITGSTIPNENAETLYVALPSDAFQVSSRAQEQKQRETYIKRVGGSNCALRVGVEKQYDNHFQGRYDGLRDFYDVGIFSLDRDRYDGTSPSFLLELQSNEISASQIAETLSQHLENTKSVSVTSVDVEANDPDISLCPGQGDSNYLTVSFMHSRGDLAKLDVLSYVGIDISVEEIQKGTLENKECSGQGLCDYTTGICNCFPGFVSSNGAGGKGNIRDCGFMTSGAMRIEAGA